MKEKFLQFFTGKMSKSIYISIAAAVVCGAVVITSVVVVHDKNKKMDAVLESLSASESVTESVTETVTESVPVSDNTKSQPQAKAANDEPAGDKALQYLTEYNALTEEYERKRAELEQQTAPFPPRKIPELSPKPQRTIYKKRPTDSEETVSIRQEKLDEEYEQKLKAWEMESQTFPQVKAQYDDKCASEQSIIESAKKELEALDAQYEKDVAALKARYGIA